MEKNFGRPFPAAAVSVENLDYASTSLTWKNTEEFIEDKYPIDITEILEIDCEVKQNGFRQYYLRDMLSKHIPLLNKKDLRFEISKISVAQPYEIFWKVLNRGDVARKRIVLGADY
ncbi:hypothetical protein O0544_05920 [Edwardsiella anguillarum]|nr:hypothetical protein [Edwardsiella anguillarum]